jgi:hypothetical protein
MVNIWKIGAWPGFPGSELSLKNKNKFINEYALPKNFVAIGYDECKAKDKTENEIRETCKKCENSGWCSKQFIDFTKKIKNGDIILLYNYGKVYTGLAQKRNDGRVHYETKDEPMHRINVKWLYNKKPKKADFSTWRDVIHHFEREHLKKIKDGELKRYLNKNLMY